MFVLELKLIVELGEEEKPFQERFFSSSPNPITFFQTFYWHLFFA